MENLIGIKKTNAVKLVNQINDLLSNYQVYYQNLRGFHWNIEGPGFFELHAKFEELYNDAHLSIDEVAERILTLEGKPYHTFTEFLEVAEIKAAKNISDAQGTVETTLSNLGLLINKERSILKLASEANDEGTIDLMSTYISKHEKLTWMLSAFLRNN